MRLLIVGGGFCGALIAKKLEKIKDIKVCLIDKKSFFEYKPSLPKILSDEKYEEKIKIFYNKFLKNTEIICETVRTITPKIVETQNEKYFYDLLVVCCGVTYPIFIKNRKDVFTITDINQTKEATDKIKRSKEILVVGGGFIGVEIVGEIINQWPEKHVTIVHSKNLLIERSPKSASDFVKKFFERQNVNIIFNERVVNHTNNIFTTDKNRKIKADMAIWSTGIKCDTSFMNGFKESIFTKKDCLKLDSYLRLWKFTNIFVGGDITDVIEEKTAHNSERHAKIISKNIQKIIKNKKLSKYYSFKGPLFISLGASKGIFVFRNFSFSGFIPAYIKDMIEWFFLRIVL